MNSSFFYIGNLGGKQAGPHGGRRESLSGASMRLTLRAPFRSCKFVPDEFVPAGSDAAVRAAYAPFVAQPVPHLAPLPASQKTPINHMVACLIRGLEAWVSTGVRQLEKVLPYSGRLRTRRAQPSPHGWVHGVPRQGNPFSNCPLQGVAIHSNQTWEAMA